MMRSYSYLTANANKARWQGKRIRNKLWMRVESSYCDLNYLSNFSEYLFTSHSNQQCVMKEEKKQKETKPICSQECNEWTFHQSSGRQCCQFSRLSSINFSDHKPTHFLSKTEFKHPVICWWFAWACRSSIYGKPDASIPVCWHDCYSNDTGIL